MYPQQTLIPFYKNVLQLTKGRGEHTLAKIDSFLFRSNRQISINNHADISIYLPPDPHFFRYLTQSHEQHISHAIAKLVKEGDTVVDIGANVGYFSAYAIACVGRQGKVFSLEPEAKNFQYLKENCDFLQRGGYNCAAYNSAASSVNGTATLNIHRYSTYHAIEDENHQLDKVEEKQIIHTVTLDEWTKEQEIESISLLKIDTEGHEEKVLTGATKLFTKGVINFTILECRSDKLASYIDKFAQDFHLYQLVWDGYKWLETNASSLNYRTECLLSRVPLSTDLLC